MAIECPKCKSKKISEKMMFQFSTSKCLECGYEYYLSLWYRFSVHVFFWTIGVFGVTFKYIIDPDTAPDWIMYAAIFILLALPITYYSVVYYFFRDIPAENGIPKAHSHIFWFLSIATILPAVVYTYG